MPTFTPKAWQNLIGGGTPIDAAALTDVEQRLANFATASPTDLGITRVGQVLPATANGTYVFYYGGHLIITATNSAFAAFPFDPADYTIPAGKTLKLHVRWACLTNNVAPGQSYACHCWPVATSAGGAAVNTITLGTSLGSTTFTTPAANTMTQQTAEFTAPAAGLLALGYIVTGAAAASSSTVFIPRIGWRAN